MSKVIAVDVGGTFTDVVCVEDGRVSIAKAPTDPQSSERSVLAAAGQLGLSGAEVFNLASTAGLNALLTRRLPKIGFLTTWGHRDILDQGSVIRPLEALTDPTWRRGFGDAGGRPLVPRYLRRGIRERLLASGETIFPLDEAQAREELARLRRCGVEGVAICLLHAPTNDAHEQRLRELLREELGDIPCSISSETSPFLREYFRATTTVVDVMMKIFYGAYDARLQAGLANASFTGGFNYADCAANLLPRDYAMERPYQLVLGGPAGGAVSAAHFGRATGDQNLLCADVGGTSVDISLIVDGEPWSSNTFEVEHDLVVNATSINIVTLGAGGGSIVEATPAGDIATGPDSAGAFPGPACYNAGGVRPTVTDAALAIGILSEDGFLGGQKRLRRDLALKAFEDLDTLLPLADRIRFGWRMAVNNIAEGLLNITVARGIDPRDFSLVACGAAGPMLLPSLLDDFPVRRVIVPPFPGLFSALGLVSTDRVYTDRCGRLLTLTPDRADELDALYRGMEARLRAKVGAHEAGRAHLVRTFDARFAGQSWETPLVPAPEGAIDAAAVETMIATFRETYEKLNGNRFEHFPVESVGYRVQLVLPAAKVDFPQAPPSGAPVPSGEILLRYLDEASQHAFEYRRHSLGLNAVIQGPAVIREDTSTTFVPKGRTATVGAHGEIVIQ
jgi:N-methylhydantoinase A